MPRKNMISRREFCIDVAATLAVGSPLATLAESSSGLKPLIKYRGGKSKEYGFDGSDFDEGEETLDDLKYRYLEFLQNEGSLNEVAFDRPEWDEESDIYTIEHHGVDKLKAMVPDDVLIRHFGEYRVMPLLEARDEMKVNAV